MSNPNWGKVGGTWTNVTNAYVKNLGSWTEFDEGHKNIGGSWTKFYDKHSGGATDYVKVNVHFFTAYDDCACDPDGPPYEIWYSAGYTLAVGDWVNDSIQCAQVVELNVDCPVESCAAASSVMAVDADCAACNDSLEICTPECTGPC